MAAIHTVPGRRIGIDLEKSGGIDIDSVLSVAFSPEERGLYKNRPVQEIISVFTMKEAYLKITGRGFHEVITKVTVKHDKIFYEGKEVSGLGSVTFPCKNEYITSIIYDIYEQ